MSVIQSTQPELRYIKRQNLENEARVIGNYYRDLIRSYGVDCIYSKLDTSEFANFKETIDRNTILKQAYGIIDNPDYSMSAHILTYMEVENDIFQLNKFGLNPNADVNFYFENNDFACALATKAGQFKEYPIKETEIVCEVPECNNEYEEYDEYIDKTTGKPIKQYLSANIFPYHLGLGSKEKYYAENLSGSLYVAIEGYELGKETTVVCYPYEHTDFNVQFDSNSDLYKCLKHKIENDDYIETMIFLTFSVEKVQVGTKTLQLQPALINTATGIYSLKNVLKKINKYLSFSVQIEKHDIDFDNITSIVQFAQYVNFYENQLSIPISHITTIEELKTALCKLYSKTSEVSSVAPDYKYILTGKLHGNILFYDISELGKYPEKIHPAVGDLVTIDFPDEANRERYEITECFDKQLTQDGISPLLHKYIWKCKARRYVNSYEDAGYNEADERTQEKLDYQSQVIEETVKKISVYDNNEDAAYGGYELDKNTIKDYDKQDVRNMPHVKYEELPEGRLINIYQFNAGSKLCTDGYNLVFVTNDDEMYLVTVIDRELAVKDAIFESGLRWLKATKDQIVFVNIEGTSTQIACSFKPERELNLDNLYESTIDANNATDVNGSFLKFNSCKTYMFATGKSLFAKLESDKSVYQII